MSATDRDAGELLRVADELYALPISDFTPTRDARSKQLKASHDPEESALAGPVKALRKPSLAAWVLNLLVRREPEQVEQVLQVGAALRDAQAGMSADELRALTRQRRQLTAAVTTQARTLAREEGIKVTEAVAVQVEATLTAAMVSRACGDAVRSGLLVAALATTGLDDLDPADFLAAPEALGFAASPTTATEPAPPELKVVPDPDADAKAVAAAWERLETAEEQVDEARQALDEAAGDVESLRARQLQLEAEVDELRRRIAALEETYDEVDDELGDAETVREEAAASLADVVEQCNAARAALDRLS